VKTTWYAAIKDFDASRGFITIQNENSFNNFNNDNDNITLIIAQLNAMSSQGAEKRLQLVDTVLR
jgi:hypothetical protein